MTSSHMFQEAPSESADRQIVDRQMKIHKLAYSVEKAPDLQPDDPDAVVWGGDERKPPIIAKRVDEWCWFRIAGLGSFRFAPESDDLSVSCVAYPERQNAQRYLVDSYYRSVVPLALQVYGLETMHGTAVETPSGAVALCGYSHAGKTTLTYALSARGNRVLADDGVVIEFDSAEASSSRPLLRPIPFALMMREPSAAYFGTSVKDVVVIDDDEPIEPVSGIPLAAVVLLDRVEAGEVPITTTKLDLRDAFTTLMAHCYAFSLDKRDRTGRMVSSYIRFAAAVPVYRLTYPSGMDRLDDVAAALERLAVGDLEASGAPVS